MIGKGIYRAGDPKLGEVAYVDWSTINSAEPFLTRDTYEANGYEPPFDQLPTKEEYRAQHA